MPCPLGQWQPKSECAQRLDIIVETYPRTIAIRNSPTCTPVSPLRDRYPKHERGAHYTVGQVDANAAVKRDISFVEQK